MRFQLKDYQFEAVEEVLSRLTRAKDAYQQYGDIGAFSLSATTGAGKTVMATAVFEALFHGSEEFDFEADPTAVVLWVTDDPSLNEQTKARILEAGGGEPIGYGQLDVIAETFDQELFDVGHIYFLNIQKLSSNSNMVKRVDKRQFTVWDTIRNTINDPRRTLYLVLDEAHRGMKRAGNGGESRPTIVQRLVNGHDDVPPAPIVWGISATIARFDAAMKAAKAEGRTLFPNVQVDPVKVQQSGLLKDTICLDFPDEDGDFETTLLRIAARDTRDAARLWTEYAEMDGLPEPVVPLLVVQVPNTPKDADLIRFIDTIYEAWPGLPADAVAHVFGERAPLDLGKYKIPYIEPQRVQDSTHVQVLLAKDAISTGWDCPRAEVMISLRTAQDPTYITQLLGRMVRTPLARRIESDERLNAVTCVLPHFKRETAIQVAQILTGEVEVDDDPDAVANRGMGRRILLAPETMGWNNAIPDEVKVVLESLPSESPPRGNKKPIKRLLALAAAIAIDGLRGDPNKEAREALFGALDGFMAEHAAAVKQGVEDIFRADIRRVTRDMSGTTHVEVTRAERADDRTVADAFRAAKRALGAAIANGYVRRLAEPSDEGEEPDIVDAQARVAALVSLEGVVDELERRAGALADKWLDELRVPIRGLPESRQAIYSELRERSDDPQPADLVVPTSRVEETVDKNGKAYPTEKLHVLADPEGRYPVGKLNASERTVLKTELERKGTVAWYRNPSRASADAVRVPYQAGDGSWKSMQPDLIIFSRTHDGRVAASIVDPHGTYLADALPKLKGLARFAEKYGDQFLRIDAIAEIDKELRVLDMKNEKVRLAVEAATGSDAEPLYQSDVSAEYV